MVDASLEERLSELTRAVTRALERAKRRMAAIEGDIRAIDEKEAWSARAPWLTAAAAKAPRGARSLKVTDWSSGEPVLLELPLDPARTARDQVEEIFAEARRLRRGRVTALERFAKADAEKGQLAELLGVCRSLAEELSSEAADPDAIARTLDDLERRLANVAPSKPKQGTKAAAEAKKPYREFFVTGGLRVLVGRDAKSNDELTLHIARPHHMWLHAKDTTGSHVVACVAKGQSLTPDQLIDCAHLAAYFSSARGETIVDVSTTPRRYLRKPRKSPPGAVVLDREKVLVLRVDDARMQALLRPQTQPA